MRADYHLNEEQKVTIFLTKGVDGIGMFRDALFVIEYDTFPACGFLKLLYEYAIFSL